MSVELPDVLIDGYRRFREEILPGKKELLEKLMHGHQRPWAMVITCSDSWAIPEVILGAGPGDLFVVRNVANMVPPPDEKESEIWAAIEFAIYRLQVPYLIIMGHDDCDGMKASLGRPPSEEREPFLRHWLTYLESGKLLADRSFSKIGYRRKSVVRANVVVQLERVRSHPLVYAATKTGRMTLLGMVYNSEGGLEFYDEEREEFLPVPLD